MVYNPTRIIDLNEATAIAASDQVPLYSQSQGIRRVSITTLMDVILANVEPALNMEIDTVSPSASPATITVTPTVDGGSVWTVLTPTGTIAVVTINLPPSGEAVDGQECLFNSTQALTTLTVAATGLSVVGAPTTLAANGAFRMKFSAVNNTWYKVSS